MITDEDLIQALEQHEEEYITNDQLIQAANQVEQRRAPEQVGRALYTVTGFTENIDGKFKIHKKVISFEIHNEADDFFAISEQIDEMFQEIFNDHIKPLHENCKIGLVLHHSMFVVGDKPRPIWVPFVEKNELTMDLLKGNKKFNLLCF